MSGYGNDHWLSDPMPPDDVEKVKLWVEFQKIKVEREKVAVERDKARAATAWIARYGPYITPIAVALLGAWLTYLFKGEAQARARLQQVVAEVQQTSASANETVTRSRAEMASLEARLEELRQEVQSQSREIAQLNRPSDNDIAVPPAPKVPPAPNIANAPAPASQARAGAQHAISWPEAIARLRAERLRAVTCAGLARMLTTGDVGGALGSAYGEAKAEMDGVVSGLAVALAQGLDRTTPRVALPDLKYRMGAGFAKREAFCRRVFDLHLKSIDLPSSVSDLVGGSAEPLIEAVVAIWTHADDSDRMRRDTIRAQLEATRWPTYVDIPTFRRER